MFKYPDGADDHDAILRYRDEVAGNNRTYWDAVERDNWKNVLFYIGKHWLVWSQTVNFWRPRAFTKDQPRPVTNRIKPLVNDLASDLAGFKPPITWTPGSDQEADYVAASVADRVNSAIEKEADFKFLKPVGAKWLPLTGNLFVVSSYDNSPETGTTFIQAHRCLQCRTASMPADIESSGGMCPACGSLANGIPGMEPITLPQFEPAIDEMGQPVGVEYPRGRHRIELENVFTVRFDPHTDRFQNTPYLRISRTRDRAWVAEQYGEDFAESVAYGRHSDPYSTLLDSIGLSTAGGGYTVTSGSGDSERVLVERLWLRPHREKAPEGIYAEIVGDKVAKSSAYPYHDERGMPMLNVAHICFDIVPGRILGATRCDDIVPINEEINELDAFVKLHHRRMANALVFAPRGSNLTKLTGQPGLILEYDPLASGHRPERAAGLSPPPDLYQYREIRKREMDEIFGSYKVSRGEAPGGGIRAYAAVALLDERAQQAQSNVFINWALGWAEVARQQLNIWREFADEERTVSLGVGRWATKKFSKAQMIGGVDMDVESTQGRPMTMVAKMARISQARQEGVLNVYDPQVRFLMLRAMGIPELMPDYNKDYERAGRVLDQMLAAPTAEMMPPPPLPFDNHSIHLSVLRQFIIDEAFEALEDWRKEIIIVRAVFHYESLREDVLSTMAGPGQNSPRIGGGQPKEEGGGDFGKEEDVLDQERQKASPDVFTGARV